METHVAEMEHSGRGSEPVDLRNALANREETVPGGADPRESRTCRAVLRVGVRKPASFRGSQPRPRRGAGDRSRRATPRRERRRIAASRSRPAR